VPQSRTSLRLGQVVPPCSGSTTTVCDRVCEPPPHETVHCPQALHALVSQFVAHLPTEQARLSFRALHGSPLYCAGMETFLERTWTPGPLLSVSQKMEHAVQLDHALSSQLIGHGCVLHCCCSSRSGHGVPPADACVITLRSRILVPLPQLWLQMPHWSQGCTMQFSGHACSLQVVL
jgi:hypothetical protein